MIWRRSWGVSTACIGCAQHDRRQTHRSTRRNLARELGGPPLVLEGLRLEKEVPPEVARVRRVATVRPYGMDTAVEVSEPRVIMQRVPTPSLLIMS